MLDNDRGYNFTLSAASSLNPNCPIEDYEFSVVSASIGRDEGLYRLELSEDLIRLVLVSEPSAGIDLITIIATARGG